MLAVIFVTAAAEHALPPLPFLYNHVLRIFHRQNAGAGIKYREIFVRASDARTCRGGSQLLRRRIFSMRDYPAH
jgi:hypothetical protein